MKGSRLSTRIVLFACFAVLLASRAASGQGLQSGELFGVVVDAAGLAAPGATVTVSSDALQGARGTVTDTNGAYVVKGLPPGQYRAVFELSGFATVEQAVTVDLGKRTEVNVGLSPAGIAVAVNVPARTTAPELATVSGGQNFSYSEAQVLPLTRTPFGIASLSTGLTTNAPNGGQLTVNGAFGFDNVLLVDGVDIGDNLFGSANTLYIEDAIDATQVLTSAIPSEYGRFSGGVVNVITKSGGDRFSGSYRLNLTNDAWQVQTPFEKRNGVERRDHVNLAHEATAGGPIKPSTLWFFGALRHTRLNNRVTLPLTGLPFDVNAENTRAELKLTGTLAGRHTVMLGYMNNPLKQRTLAFGERSVGPGLEDYPETPNDRWMTTYRGAVSSRMFADVRYSRKHYGIRESGGTDTSLRTGSPFFTLAEGYHYNAPYFDATDPEDRDNWQFAGNLSYWLTTGRGSHDIKGGGEVFNSTYAGGNSQSPTNYVFDANFLQTATGSPVFDSEGRLIPVWSPGETYNEHWISQRGAQLDIKTTSLFVQDHWLAGRRLAFDLGLRYERARSEATGGRVTVDSNALMPRLAATFDVDGTGRFVAEAGYAHYSGKYTESQFGKNTPVGTPNVVYAIYLGPPGVGNDFAPGFDLSNYLPFFGIFPTANVSFDAGIHSPLSKEVTLSFGSRLGGSGHAKVMYVRRSLDGFVEDFIDMANGTTLVPDVGLTLTNRRYANSDLPSRKYQGLDFVGRYSFTPAWTAEAGWTVQLQNEGNFVGEAESIPTAATVIGDYASVVNGSLVNTIYSEARHYPTGRLPGYQRHKGRIWTTYSLGLGWAGTADLALLYRYDSPRVYNIAAQSVALTTIQRVAGTAAGYRDLPNGQTLYFEGRGTGEFEASHLFDVGVQYRIPVFRSAAPYVKLDAFNIFNSVPLIGFNTTVAPDVSSGRDALGLPTAYTKGPSFGVGTSTRHYPRPRAFQVAVGFRF
ncbi:MAG: carboxypeptidase regulatory-like domain-containing protein [Vicinamibacterales bacterium]